MKNIKEVIYMSMISNLIKNDIERNPLLKRAYQEQDEALEFAMTVVKLRDELGWSQRKLADELGKPQSTIARIENGDSKPNLETMEAIARVTKKTVKNCICIDLSLLFRRLFQYSLNKVKYTCIHTYSNTFDDKSIFKW
ncbi:helix-turn-helix domain-containing protein [Staphylococcus warneri]